MKLIAYTLTVILTLLLSQCSTSYQHPPCPPDVDVAIQAMMR